MPSRSPLFARLMGAADAALSVAARQLVAEWLQGNDGQEFIRAIEEMRVHRARFLLWTFCQKVPAAAGVVSFLMGASPETAINSIGIFDKALAERLRTHLPAVEAFWEEWQKPAPPQAV